MLVPGAAQEAHVTGLTLGRQRPGSLALVAGDPVGVDAVAGQVANRGLGRLLATRAGLLFGPDVDGVGVPARPSTTFCVHDPYDPRTCPDYCLPMPARRNFLRTSPRAISYHIGSHNWAPAPLLWQA